MNDATFGRTGDCQWFGATARQITLGMVLRKCAGAKRYTSTAPKSCKPLISLGFRHPIQEKFRLQPSMIRPCGVHEAMEL
jgi:hypothetical protein